jgi:uncharacterized oligopeptide transporter (OPT) family protein
MSEPTAAHLPLSGVIPKPPGTREFSGRAILAGVVVAAIMGASYPYIVLKLGFGPNVSVVAAFFGYLFLGIAGLALRNRSNRWENNIVQTAGTSAAQTAFMCVILAAFDFLSQNKALGYSFSPTATESFIWLFAASVLGILLAVPLRKHYVEEENLTFADGVAAAETVMVLDARGSGARQAAAALFTATLLSAIGWLLTQKWGGEILNAIGFDVDPTKHLIKEIWAPDMWGLAIATAGGGFAFSLLSIGSGMIVGNRINVSMAIGGLLSVGVAARVLFDEGIIPDQSRRSLLLWVMWPGTGMLIAGGLTALFLKWRTLKRSFTTMSSGAIDSSEFPLRWVGLGVVAATITLLIAQYVIFDLEPWFTLIAIVLSVPLMLVGLRVLGETNWGPISQLTNMMQAVFAGLGPGNLTHNLAASGTTGTIAVQSEAIMQDYKAGHIIGSTPRFLTYAQLIAAPIGAAAVAFMYPLLRDTYGIGGDGGLASPISIRIAGFADVLNRGFDALPEYSLIAMMIGAAVGILITLLETRWKDYVPSATGLGIGMMVPAAVVFSMVLGGILLSAWLLVHRRSAERLSMPLASGLIAGEALAAIVVPLFIWIGWLSL